MLAVRIEDRRPAQELQYPQRVHTRHSRRQSKQSLMFTGIIETVGEVQETKEEGSNRIFTIKSSISSQLKVDQSLSHNGVCLTVVEVKGGTHSVVAVKETLSRTSLGALEQGSHVN